MVVKKRIPTSLKVDPELWEEVKIMAIRTKKNITEYFEDALREKLVKDYEVVAVERKMKEQEKLHQEEVNRRYQQIVGQDPGPLQEEQPASQQPQSQQLQKQQPHPLEQKSSDIFNKDTIVPLVGDQFELKLWMPSLKFSTDKEKLIQYAKNLNPHERESILGFIEKIADIKYNDVYQLEEAIKKACNSDRDLIEEAERNGIDEGMIVGCRIIVDKDKSKYLNLIHGPEDKQLTDEQKLLQWEQQRLQQPQQFRDIFKQDDAHPPKKENETDISLYIPDLEFPASKEQIIDYVKKSDRGKIKLFIVERISNKTFNDKDELQDDIVNSFANNKELRDFMKKGGKDYEVIRCDIITRKDAAHRLTRLYTTDVGV